MSIYNQVINNLEKLKLFKMKEILSNYLDSIKKERVIPLEILKYLKYLYLKVNELELKKERTSNIRVKISNFPYIILKHYQILIFHINLR